jgi:arsenate reductase
MAEGWLRKLLGGRIEAFSAGTVASRVSPDATAVMAEVGIDLSGHRSKSVAEFEGESFDLVVTVCDSARDACPLFPGATRQIHLGFSDPVRVPSPGSDGLDEFRRVRDEIRERLVPRVAEELGIAMTIPGGEEEVGDGGQGGGTA